MQDFLESLIQNFKFEKLGQWEMVHIFIKQKLPSGSRGVSDVLTPSRSLCLCQIQGCGLITQAHSLHNAACGTERAKSAIIPPAGSARGELSPAVL